MALHSPELSNLSAKPIGIEVSSLPRMQLNDIIAKELGLNNGQVVRAVADAPGQLRLVNGNPNALVATALPGEVGQMLNFRYVVSIYGRYLQQLQSPSVSRPAEPAVAPTSNSLAASLLLGASDTSTNFLGTMGLVQIDKWLALVGRPDLREQFGRLKLAPENMTADIIKQGLLRSGLFTEALLYRGRANSDLDFKQLFITLQRLLRQSAPAEAAVLKRIVEVLEGNQFEALAADGRKEVLLRCYLPLGDTHLIQLEIEAQQDSTRSGQRLWSVYLETEHQELDHIAVKSVLTAPGQVDLTIWAVKAETVSVVRAMVSELRYELAAQDLVINVVHIVQGRRVPLETANSPGALMDVRT